MEKQIFLIIMAMDITLNQTHTPHKSKFDAALKHHLIVDLFNKP